MTSIISLGILMTTRRTQTAFAVTSLRQRIITTAFLVLLVSTVIPYQFAYMVLCIVQFATSIRALRLLWETVHNPLGTSSRSETDVFSERLRITISSTMHIHCLFSCFGCFRSIYPSWLSGSTIWLSIGSHHFRHITIYCL